MKLPFVRRTRRKRQGAAAVEFAIVAPVFFMVMIGLIEIGRAIMVQQVLINASRVGARQATLMTSSQDAVVAAVSQYASGVGLSGVSVAVSPNPATATPGTSISVQTSLNFADATWLPSPWFMGNKVLSSSSVMRKEGF